MSFMQPQRCLQAPPSLPLAMRLRPGPSHAIHWPDQPAFLDQRNDVTDSSECREQRGFTIEIEDLVHFYGGRAQPSVRFGTDFESQSARHRAANQHNGGEGCASIPLLAKSSIAAP
jgi:hypothetical protein